MFAAVSNGKPCYEVSAGSLGWGKPMSIDWEVAKVWFVVIALIAFNLPIGVAAWKFRNTTGLGEVLQEKNAEGEDTRGAQLQPGDWPHRRGGRRVAVLGHEQRRDCDRDPRSHGAPGRSQ